LNCEVVLCNAPHGWIRSVCLIPTCSLGDIAGMLKDQTHPLPSNDIFCQLDTRLEV
jgi:hypothetical protein